MNPKEFFRARSWEELNEYFNQMQLLRNNNAFSNAEAEEIFNEASRFMWLIHKEMVTRSERSLTFLKNLEKDS